MALVEFYKPRSLSGQRLDRYLAGGWFRSSNGLFRNRLLCLEGKLCTVVNIRLPLKNHTFSASHKRLLKKTEHFTVEIAPLSICPQMDVLYDLTKKRFKGFVFPELHSFLFDYLDRNVFSSWHVKIYDGKRLIAASVFDFGKTSVMSVLGMYDPEYRRVSPGILTMLHEIKWAKEQNYKLYYPGYVLDEAATFDYKLSLGEYTFMNASKRWTKDYDKVVTESPVHGINQGSNELERALLELKIPHQRLLYKLFSLGYAYPEGTFSRQQIIFVLPELSDNPFKISLAAYDYDNDLFRLSHPLPIQDTYLSENQSSEFLDPHVYYDMILQDSTDDHSFSTSVTSLVAEINRLWMKRSQKNPVGHVFLGKP